MRSLDRQGQGDLGSIMLAGLETGVLGSVCVSAYYSLGAWILGQGLWLFPARLAVAVFGRKVSAEGLGAAAAAGISLQVFVAGLLGIVFALLVRQPYALHRTYLLGPLLALSWYYLGYEVLLRRFGHGAVGFIPRRTMVVAHLIFGLFLGTYPRFLHLVRSGAGRQP